MIKISITKILDKLLNSNELVLKSKLLEKRMDEHQSFIELSVKENRELKNDISKINLALNKILENPNNILENSNNNSENKNQMVIPKLICELKFDGITSHGLITYSEYSSDIKSIFPESKYSSNPMSYNSSSSSTRYKSK